MTASRVDFYHLTEGGAEQALPALAAKALAAGERMIVADADAARREAIARALWAAPGFFANGTAGGNHDSRQPLLIAADLPEGAAANGARLAALADGTWREAARGYDRVFLLFGDAGREGARACWRLLDGGPERRYWVQTGGGWREGP